MDDWDGWRTSGARMADAYMPICYRSCVLDEESSSKLGRYDLVKRVAVNKMNRASTPPVSILVHIST
jgi:hypothetical protein